MDERIRYRRWMPEGATSVSLGIGIKMQESLESLFEQRITDIGSIFAQPQSWPVNKLVDLSREVIRTFLAGNKLAFLGNGGSAAEAMHLAAEFTGKCVVPHSPLPAICLNESQSALTAISNDFGSEFIFSRQVEAHLKKDDILIALSTSGTSKNVLNALESGRSNGVRLILWTGLSAPELKNVDIWRVPSNSTPRIQEVHLAWGHLLAEVVELNENWK